jgi:hypothetical protein
LIQRFAQVNDVDAVARVKDERFHLGVPPLGLVSKVNTCIQQFLHTNTNHNFPFVKSPSRKGPSRGTRD